MVFPACLQNIHFPLSKLYAITPLKKDMLFCLLLLFFWIPMLDIKLSQDNNLAIAIDVSCYKMIPLEEESFMGDYLVAGVGTNGMPFARHSWYRGRSVTFTKRPRTRGRSFASTFRHSYFIFLENTRFFRFAWNLARRAFRSGMVYTPIRGIPSLNFCLIE